MAMASAVDVSRQFAVRSAGGVKVLVPFGAFAAQIEDLLEPSCR